MSQGNLVFNGDFKNNADGWIITNCLFGGFQPTKGNPAGSVALDNLSPSSSTDPTMSQTINGLTPGIIYVISGDFSAITDRGGVSSGFSFGVAIDGIFLFEAAAQLPGSLQQFNFVYTATSVNALLSLSAQRNGTGVTYEVDNIAMYAIPEPSILSLLFLGGGFLIYARRLRD